MTRPRFTVLLPTHNRADVLGHAIDSVLRQTEPDFELLVVADGCTDDTAAVVAKFGDARLRFFDLPKAPYFGYANRAIAMRQATGRLVAYAAHDDLLFPDHLQLLGALLDSAAGADWVYSRPLWVSTDGIVVPFMTDLRLADERAAFAGGDNTLPMNCVAHTRAVYEAAGGWPQEVPSAADWLLWGRMLGLPGTRLAVLPVPTGLHFNAVWRPPSRYSGMDVMRTLLAVADAADAWWPAVLRVPPEAGLPEQTGFARALAEDGAAWCQSVRDGADTVVARLAWDAVRDLLPRLTRAETGQAALEAQLIAAAEAGAARAEADRATLCAATAQAAAAHAALEAEHAALRATTEAAAITQAAAIQADRAAQHAAAEMAATAHAALEADRDRWQARAAAARTEADAAMWWETFRKAAQARSGRAD